MQINFDPKPPIGKPGMALNRGGSENHFKNVLAQADLPAGAAHVNGDLPGAKPAAAPDALLDDVATVALGTTHALNAPFPEGKAGPVVIVQSDNAHHIATTRFVVKGYGPYGEAITESVPGVDGGDATLTTLASFSHVISIQAGPFGGTAGTYDCGWGVPTHISKKSLGFVVGKKLQEESADVAQNDVFLSLDHGAIWVYAAESHGLSVGDVPFAGVSGSLTATPTDAYELPGCTVSEVDGALVAVEVM